MTGASVGKPTAVLVTGAAGGIGREIAFSLGRRGVAVLVNDVDPGRVSAVVKELRAAGVDAADALFDVRSTSEANTAVAKLLERYDIDGLVNNAGAWVVKPFHKSDRSDWEQDIELNLYGVLTVTRAVIEGMMARGGGSIVSVVSDAARVGDPTAPPYAAAKGAVISFSKSIAQAYGRKGIRANCVALGVIETPRTESMLSDEKIRTALLKRYPAGRLGKPSDVAATVAFLLSDKADWITGQVLPVNGGYSMIG
ncbi:SDR family oxidoreductase [Amycolatopsis acidiphila]|uniref:SDR family NAD(P)-dependent oxidoreductase n=1 Tax=Amycolatopsis acidiphila TaxID=715473 RepID=UPI00164392BA|nr:SDR family NAD(P)-dependent oxidoreductase [Amycolatopsis acidiphila]UIJ61128.1 SDR family oxidoreductase [Amycolatopsis acidiphila]GHG86550.1 glucose 1-dehydrogenase [Amycolatopsis acidiphila]